MDSNRDLQGHAQFATEFADCMVKTTEFFRTSRVSVTEMWPSYRRIFLDKVRMSFLVAESRKKELLRKRKIQS